MVTTHDGTGSGSEPPDELLWSIKTVVLKTGLSRASIYRYIKRGRFPARRRVGPNRVAWVANEILAWIQTCPCLPRAWEGPRDRLPDAPLVRLEQGAVVSDDAHVDAPSIDPAMAARNQP
jgi:prophage regulatory protein